MLMMVEVKTARMLKMTRTTKTPVRVLTKTQTERVIRTGTVEIPVPAK